MIDNNRQLLMKRVSSTTENGRHHGGLNPISLSFSSKPSSERIRWVRMCCFILSFRVNALLHIGHCTLFSPVCFLPCRAACPDVVNVAVHLCDRANGHGYLFFRMPRGRPNSSVGPKRISFMGSGEAEGGGGRYGCGRGS